MTIEEQLQRNIELYGEAPVKEIHGCNINTAIKGCAVVVDEQGRAKEHWLCDLKALVQVRMAVDLRT